MFKYKNQPSNKNGFQLILESAFLKEKNCFVSLTIFLISAFCLAHI